MIQLREAYFGQMKLKAILYWLKKILLATTQKNLIDCRHFFLSSKMHVLFSCI